MKIPPFKEINPPNDKGYWINKKTNQSFGGQYASPVLLANLKKYKSVIHLEGNFLKIGSQSVMFFVPWVATGSY